MFAAVENWCSISWELKLSSLLTTALRAWNCTSNVTLKTSDGFKTGRTILSFEESRAFLKRYSADCVMLCPCPDTTEKKRRKKRRDENSDLKWVLMLKLSRSKESKPLGKDSAESQTWCGFQCFVYAMLRSVIRSENWFKTQTNGV